MEAACSGAASLERTPKTGDASGCTESMPLGIQRVGDAEHETNMHHVAASSSRAQERAESVGSTVGYVQVVCVVRLVECLVRLDDTEQKGNKFVCVGE